MSREFEFDVIGKMTYVACCIVCGDYGPRRFDYHLAIYAARMVGWVWGHCPACWEQREQKLGHKMLVEEEDGPKP